VYLFYGLGFRLLHKTHEEDWKSGILQSFSVSHLILSTKKYSLILGILQSFSVSHLILSTKKYSLILTQNPFWGRTWTKW